LRSTRSWCQASSPLDEGQQLRDAEEARVRNPYLAPERRSSHIAYASASSEEAAKIDGEAFPQIIGEPVGGPPQLPAGESITGYPTDNAAQVDLGEGKRAVLESLEPIAVERRCPTVPGDSTTTAIM